MSGTATLARRELRALVTSGTPWAVAAAFLLISGLLFWGNATDFASYSQQSVADPATAAALNTTQAVIPPTVHNLGVVGAFVLPFLTMRLIAEDRRSGTLEHLQTLPLTDGGIIVAKFAAAAAVTAGLLVAALTQPLALALGAPVAAGHVLAGWAGAFAALSTLAAVGLAISALAPTPVVAASVNLTLNLGLVVLDQSAGPQASGLVGAVASGSPLGQLNLFSQGVVTVGAVVALAVTTLLALGVGTAALTLERRFR